MFEHLDKLQALEDRYIDLEAKISDPSVISDQAQWQKYTKAHAKLTDVVETYRAYQKLQKTGGHGRNGNEGTGPAAGRL